MKHCANKYLGQKKMMKCGLEAEIIEYLNYDNIVVRFNDGTIKTSTMDYFKKGGISSFKSKYLGQKKMMKCGLEAEIIEYEDAKHIVVRLDDGTIKTGSLYSFKIGSMGISGYKHLGQERLMNCGLRAKIVDYKRAIDITVQFEDMTTKTADLKAFRDGKVLHTGLVYNGKHYRLKDTNDKVISSYFDNITGRYRVITENKDGTRSIEIL